MGHRSNVVVKHGQHAVYFYAHWRGPSVAIALQCALALRAAWNDETYLTRIIFDRFCNDHEGTDSFGIGLAPMDNEYNVLLVDPSTQEVTLWDRALYDEFPSIVAGACPAEPLRRWSFAEYVAANESSLVDAVNERAS